MTKEARADILMASVERNFYRIRPSEENPLTVSFGDCALPKSTVLNISIGGIGIHLPGAKTLLKIGTEINSIELNMPGEGTIRASGFVKFIGEDVCGIEFKLGIDFDSRPIARYITRREAEILYEERQRKLNPQMPQDAEPQTQAQETRKVRILIVDDSEAVRAGFGKFFLSNGFEVIAAKDGADGIKASMEHKPDIILMDVNMPVLSGLETTRIIKAHPLTKNIPILMLTSESDKKLVINSIKAGAIDYIIKSDDLTVVLERIARAVKIP